jgi:hypothetical protein
MFAVACIAAFWHASSLENPSMTLVVDDVLPPAAVHMIEMIKTQSRMGHASLLSAKHITNVAMLRSSSTPYFLRVSSN